MASFETVKQRRDRLATELEKLNKIDNKTPEQKKRATKLFNEVRLLDSRIIQAKKLKDKRASTLEKAKTAKAKKKRIEKTEKAAPIDPKRAPSVDRPAGTSGTQQPPSSAEDKRPRDTLEAASAKARKARADEAKAKAEAEKAKLRKAAALKSEARQPRTDKQKKAARDASFDTVPKRPKAQSSDTLGVAAKEGKAAQEKRETARRKKQAYTVDPSSYKINPMESPGGYADLSKAEKSAETAKMARALKKASSFDKDKDIFHKIAYGISQLTGQEPTIGSSDPRVSPGFPEREEMMKYLKKGGKVKKKKKSKKQYTSKKKYSMNRGGIASVRKPTRA